MVAQLKLRCHSVCSVAQLEVMRFVADALRYRAGQPVGTTGMSVGEMAVYAVVKPLRNGADGKRRRRQRMQPCLGTC